MLADPLDLAGAPSNRGRLQAALCRHGFALVFGLLLIVSLIPIWAVRFHPIADLPAHLAAVSVWHHYNDPRFDFAQYYQLYLGITPYWGYYLLCHLLSFPFGLDGANRVVLSLYILGLPLGLKVLAGRFGRSPWLSLFAFPLLWNYNFAIGFVPFCLGLALCLFALAAFDAFCDQPTPARGALAAFLGALCFFAHLLPWSLYLACAGLMGLLHRGLSLRTLAPRVAVWAVALGAGLAVILGGTGHLHMGSGIARRLTWKVYPYLDSLRDTYVWAMDVFATRDDEVLCAVLALCWLILRLSARRGGLRLHDLRAFGCFLVASVAYIVLPRSLLSPSYWWGINIRFAACALLFAALCIPGEIRGWRRLIFVPVALCGLGFAIATTVHWGRVNYAMRGLDELAQKVPPRSRVLVLVFGDLREPSMTLHFYSAAIPLYQAYYGGYQAFNFDEGFPLRYKQRYPAPSWQGPVFRWEAHAPYYDYVLAFQADEARLFAGHQAEVVRVDTVGRFSLYKLPGPRRDRSPGPVYPSAWATDPFWYPSDEK